MYKLISKSIKLKIVLSASIVLMIIGLSNVVYTSYSTREYAIENAKKTARLEADKFAAMFKTKIDDALTLSRTMSSVFGSVKASESYLNLEREEGNTIIRELTERNPTIIGAFIAWIPDNSFDGKDQLYANKPGACPTGRYTVYYTWGNGKVTKQPETEWDYEKTSDYFLKPKEKGIECIIDPYYYPVDGVDVLMVSLPCPIINNKRFYGVSSVDISVAFIQEIADSANLFNKTGIVSIISNNGTVAGATGKVNFAGKKLDSIKSDYKLNRLKEMVEKGDAYSGVNNDVIEVLTPVWLGKTDTPWAVLVQVPLEVPMETANNLILAQIIISFLLSSLGVIVLLILTGRITKPLVLLTAFVEKISKGVVDTDFNIKSKDEVGILADTFKNMSVTLESIINDIKFLGQNLEQGKLDYRANSKNFQGVFKEMLDSMNTAINSIVRPLNVAAEYVDRIAKGDIPPKIIEDYKGDFNEIKNNLNQCIDAITFLVKDTNSLVNSATLGKLNERADSTMHLGDFKQIVEGINSTLDRLVGLIDNLPVPVQIIDKNYDILYLNKSAQLLN